MIIDRPFWVTCDAHGTAAMEMFSIEKQRSRLILSSDIDLKDTVREILLDVPQWLSVAAEAYNISSDIKDYILQPVISMPSDLPNRNCVAGDTLVATNKGLIPIKNINGSDATEVITKDGKAKIKAWMRTDYKKTREIRTEKGNKLRTTLDHPYLVLTDNCHLKWKDAKDLIIGDILIVRTGSITNKSVNLQYATKQVKIFQEKEYNNEFNGGNFKITPKFPTKMTTRFARFLGYYTSEGCIGKNKIVFYNTDPDIVKDYTECCKELFGLEPKIYIVKKGRFSFFNGHKIESKKDTSYCYLHRKDLIKWLEYLNIKPCLAETKYVPDCILQSKPKHIKHFLVGYVEGDGCIKNHQIRMHTMSYTLAHQLKILWENIGCIAIQTQRESGLYEVNCTNSLNTASSLKFISSRRKETIKEWKEWQSNTYNHNSRHEMLPLVVTDWTKDIVNQHLMFAGSRSPEGQYVDYKGRRVAASFQGQLSAKKISKEKAKNMLPTLGMLNPKYKQQMKELLGDFYFDKVESFSDNNVLEPVYDLTTTAGQFTGNGIVVHNCQAFPFTALSGWTPDAGCIMYKTWNGKPVFEEHCFPASAPINTKIVTKNIIDVNVGDEVLTHKGRYRKVINKYSNGIKYLSEIICQGLPEPIYATENHPFFSKNTFVPLSDLKVGNYLYLPYEDEYVLITSIKHKVKQEETYNLEVEEDNSYTAYNVAVHNCNQDHTKAKGIILSTMMKPIKNSMGDIWKVLKLVAFDRNRDSVLANEILAGRRNAWSMGAYARSYTCSICGSDITKQCGHLEKDKPVYKLYANRLAYWNVVDPYGFEISNVKSPAFASAKDTHHFTVNDL